MTKTENLLRVDMVLSPKMFGERRVHKKNGSSIVIKFHERSPTGNTITAIADNEFKYGQGLESINMDSPNKYTDMY
jgi:hypothetical protein